MNLFMASLQCFFSRKLSVSEGLVDNYKTVQSVHGKHFARKNGPTSDVIRAFGRSACFLETDESQHIQDDAETGTQYL
jgi:hypothetical protein